MIKNDGYIVIGLDISSSTIGWAALKINEEDIKLIKCGYIKPPNTNDFIKDLCVTRNKILEVFNNIKPDYIGIEDIIRFMKNKSSATTIITLATFNRMTCLLANDYLNKSPELFNVLVIRHGLKLNKILPKKEDMPELVAKHLKITFPYEKNNRGKILEESYDVADGIAVALYYSFVLTGKTKTKTKKKLKSVKCKAKSVKPIKVKTSRKVSK